MSQLATRARVASSATATTRANRRGGDGAGERASAPVVVVAPRLGSRCRRRVVLARRRASEEPLVARVSSAAPEERARADGGDDDDGDPKPPPTSAAAETARKNVDAAVAASSASSAALANNLDNQYLATQERFPSLPLPPEPIRFPRSPVDIKLAVMLLRSAYETVDDMNVIPMDQFQIKFWKSRQAEWEPYRNQYSPLTIEQGKLADPLYFDFISYVQFNVIARELPRSDVVFEERNGAEGTVSVIRRDASLGTDNKILTPAFAQRLGDALYARARFGFEDATFPGVPEPSSPGDVARVADGMRGLVDAFCAKGYALRGGVRDLGPGSGGQGTESREVVVKLEGPAQLWGARQLSARGVVPNNEYLGMAATGFCRASGVRSSYRASYTDVAAELTFTLAPPR